MKEGEENSAFLRTSSFVYRPSKIMRVNIPLRAITPFPAARAITARELTLGLEKWLFFVVTPLLPFVPRPSLIVLRQSGWPKGSLPRT
jgi:hypothetical protein